MTNLVSVENLTFGFRNRLLYQNLTFSLRKGSMTSLIGANGVGKTTLVRLLMRQLNPITGTISFMPGLKLGYVPQFRNIDSEYPLSIRNFVQLNQLGHIFPWHTLSERRQVDKALQQTQLVGRQNQALGQASGGEKQKAYLAQALLVDPNFLILDEATASLDVNTKLELMTLVRELNQSLGLTVLFVTHDLPLAKKFTDQCLLLTSDSYQMRSTDEMDEDFLPKELQSYQEVR